MKLPDAFQSILGKKKEKEPVYISLYLDVHMVAASVWHILKETSHVIASAHLSVPTDTWKDRIASVDRLLGAMEQKTERTDLTTAILGLPAVYLTQTGEIKKEIRADIKNLAQTLELKLAGFVPLHQSIIFKLKTDEGVPPSVILLGINSKTIAISLYKIGALVGLRDLEKHEDVAKSLEEGFKSFTEMEVLPARILLYGSEEKELEEIKNKLLHHPWTTRANFLHFPKIEIVSIDMIIDSVSLAGASEMKKETIPQGMEQEEEPPAEKSDESTVEAEAVVGGTFTQAEAEMEENEDEEEIEAEYEEEPRNKIVTEEDRIVEGEIAQTTQALASDFDVDKEVQDDANVVVVDAESLGFKKDADVLEEEEQIEKEEARVHQRPAAVMSSVGSTLGGIGSSIPRVILAILRSPKQKYFGILLVLLAVGLVWAGFSWAVPRAIVTVYEISQTVEADQTITIDSNATDVDTEGNVIPGLKRERSMDGEKTVEVKGKKSIGDPARGTIVIYNKSLSSRTFTKGTVVQSGSLKFTLDSDVSVASASESIGSITFGKADAAVTAQAIGAAGNLTSGSEFTFADVSSNIATARNDSAFTGGTSREVTVVSRSDVDGLISAVSIELTTKAQQELAGSVGGGEALIDGTIKTSVTQKTFDKEIDQEATQLNGKLTVTVSGIAYNQADIRSLFEKNGKLEAPSGYKMDDINTTITVTNTKVQKDGTITARAHIKAIALPTIDSAGIPKALAGKTIKDAETYLRAMSGVAGMEVSFRLSPMKNRLPFNKNNISVSVAIAQ